MSGDSYSFDSYSDPWEREEAEWRKAFALKDAEILRLRALITELCDALELPFEQWTDQSDLIQRAREATR